MQLHWLLPEVKGIPVLMYHRVDPVQSDGLTVTTTELRRQWEFLQESGYVCLTMERYLRVVRGAERAPKKAFVLTFDDGYRNNLSYVYPLLQEFGWEATIFLIAGTLDGAYEPGEGIDEKLTLSDLKAMMGPNINYGLHGYRHENYSEITLKQIRETLEAAIGVFDQSGLRYSRVLAYPYGARPARPEDAQQLHKRLNALGVNAAFRIGNKPQRLPAENIYELMRIDIRGEDSLDHFKIKLRKGKLKPF